MKRMTLRLFEAALAPALSLSLSGFATAAPASKTFRDWIAGCDNLKGCAALSLPGEAAEQIAFLKLERPGGPTGTTSLSLKIRAEKLKAPLTADLAIDGAPFPAAGKRLAATVVDQEIATIALSPDETEALIAAARKATKLSIALAGKSYDVSLAGSVAAMLWIDEQQGRLNTTSALIRRGANTNVPAVPALPVITAKGSAEPALPPKAAKALTVALRKQLKRLDPDMCEDAPDDLPDAEGAWPLAGGERLVGLLCSRGAYNLSTAFWILQGSDVAKARKAQFPQIDGKPDNVLVNAHFDPATGQVGFFSKGRGIGDCGASGNYAWTETGFVLTAFQAMDECRGIASDDWITLFRSEVKVVK
ncbi:DUF1176 domain-containing protein [Bosea lathyri]|uniref:DUF1176 domain-containing protein n=1 Tax=Bosea lathyri TaxID=1036778 RepID=A0A1H6BAL9_9HYPH|nr:DUF1176 domain-containing protein [Bosea lathyri]SEG57722.1 Protein of unknown function [Bosea lathyri]